MPHFPAWKWGILLAQGSNASTFTPVAENSVESAHHSPPVSEADLLPAAWLRQSVPACNHLLGRPCPHDHQNPTTRIAPNYGVFLSPWLTEQAIRIQLFDMSWPMVWPIGIAAGGTAAFDFSKLYPWKNPKMSNSSLCDWLEAHTSSSATTACGSRRVRCLQSFSAVGDVEAPLG